MIRGGGVHQGTNKEKDRSPRSWIHRERVSKVLLYICATLLIDSAEARDAIIREFVRLNKADRRAAARENAPQLERSQAPWEASESVERTPSTLLAMAVPTQKPERLQGATLVSDPEAVGGRGQAPPLLLPAVIPRYSSRLGEPFAQGEILHSC